MTSKPKGNVLITGAAQRIGRAIAIALAADGWTVGYIISNLRTGRRRCAKN